MPDDSENTLPPPAEAAGIYVHWPFCERKCPYCDFTSLGREDPLAGEAGAYLAALLAEIGSAPARLGWAVAPAADTVYFGGGTPSLMGPEALGRIMAALRETCALDPGAEVTLEVNPTTAEAARLDEMLALGVGRLSVGCQSFNDRILKRLGRVHDAATTRRAIAAMRAAGARNLSLDLIFGAPTQTMEDFEADLEELLGFAPEHVSAYNMTVHEGTPFARLERAGRLGLPEEEAQAAMFERLIDRLAAAGYEHYEISNWARPGRQSRHNRKYWRACDVWGFGVSAHGVAGGRRVANTADLREYLAGAAGALAAPLPPPAGERARRGEVLMLALRRVGGVGWPELDRWLGLDTRAFYAGELARLYEDGLIEDPAARLKLTRRGILLSDTAMEAFF